MIGSLSGVVKAIRKNYLIVATDYIGYKVFVSSQLSMLAEPGKPISLFTHTYVREDQLSLYGFATLPELEFFELLLTVSGIGPKMALGVMSLADLNVIKSGIISEDPSVFTKVSGVGRKTAERLIVELRGKLSEEEAFTPESQVVATAHADVIDVLMALGYSRTEARKALVEVPKDLQSSEEKVRAALRALAKQ